MYLAQYPPAGGTAHVVRVALSRKLDQSHRPSRWGCVSLRSASLITRLWRATSLASPCPRLSARHPLVTPLAVAALAIVEMADSQSHRASRSLTASFHVCLSGQLPRYNSRVTWRTAVKDAKTLRLLLAGSSG